MRLPRSRITGAVIVKMPGQSALRVRVLLREFLVHTYGFYMVGTAILFRIRCS